MSQGRGSVAVIYYGRVSALDYISSNRIDFDTENAEGGTYYTLTFSNSRLAPYDFRPSTAMDAFRS